MIDIKRATELIRQHFAELTTEQFIENLKKSCPEVFEDEQEEEIITSSAQATQTEINNSANSQSKVTEPTVS